MPSSAATSREYAISRGAATGFRVDARIQRAVHLPPPRARLRRRRQLAHEGIVEAERAQRTRRENRVDGVHCRQISIRSTSRRGRFSHVQPAMRRLFYRGDRCYPPAMKSMLRCARRHGCLGRLMRPMNPSRIPDKRSMVRMVCLAGFWGIARRRQRSDFDCKTPGCARSSRLMCRTPMLPRLDAESLALYALATGPKAGRRRAPSATSRVSWLANARPASRARRRKTACVTSISRALRRSGHKAGRRARLTERHQPGALRLPLRRDRCRARHHVRQRRSRTRVGHDQGPVLPARAAALGQRRPLRGQRHAVLGTPGRSALARDDQLAGSHVQARAESLSTRCRAIA